MARVLTATAPTSDRADLDMIESWYRRKLAEPVELPAYRWDPVRLGPTWQTELINGRRYWVLPDRTLGWAGLTWCGKWLQLTRGEPWRFTLEQARWWLHWYSLDLDGRWNYRDGVLQRLKGWGKDPIGATLGMNELVGPSRLQDWDGDRPVATDCADAWVQLAAVSLKQTKNTMKLLPGMITPAAKVKYGIQVQREQVYALGDTRFLEAVTSSPETLEGARGTFVLLNETHHWGSSNSGHDMADVIARNTTKSPGGTARTLRITNAYEPGEDSIAERDRDAYEAMVAAEKGTAGATRLLYDSLEAGPTAPLSAEAAPEVVETIRGDSSWLDVATIVDFIRDVRNPPSKSRRFWYNQVVAAEDAWMDPQEWDAIAARDELVLPDEPIVAFFDGSKNDDTTGLVGCRIADGHVFRVNSWSKPAGEAGKTWIVPRDEVDTAVAAMFAGYDVKAFFADPSDTRDDEGERFWEPTIDEWHRTYGRQLEVWAVRTGDRQHSIAWDMRSTERQGIFTEAAMRFCTEVKVRGFTHDGDRPLRLHVLNARRRTNKFGVSLGKEHRESARKVDLAVCAVGARMLRRLYMNKEPSGKKPRSGRVWGTY